MASLAENTPQEQRRIQVVPTRTPVLELKVLCTSPELKEKYKEHIDNHNNKLQNFYGDAGFDLLNPSTLQLQPGSLSNKYHLGVKFSLNHCSIQRDVPDDNGQLVNLLRVQPQGFMLVPRSSTGANTNMRLSNSLGIIDSGYRGELCALVDAVPAYSVDNDDNSLSRYKLEEGKRNFQIVSFSGFPIHVNLVETEAELGNTERGEGGFGSTGN